MFHLCALKAEYFIVDILQREAFFLGEELIRQRAQQCMDVGDGQYALEILDKNQQEHMFLAVLLLLR